MTIVFVLVSIWLIPDPDPNAFATHLGLLILVAWLITLLIAPILARVLALAVSRKRELLADATGAQFTRNPAALASALLEIEHAHVPTESIGRGAARTCASQIPWAGG